MNATEQHLKSLDNFKDWSNYLLVTTVAALGWVASDGSVVETPIIEVWAFALSIVFGIFTLALIPIVAAGITDASKSFYDVSAPFRLFWLWGPEVSLRIKTVCWPQHILFLAGIIAFAVHVTCPNQPPHKRPPTEVRLVQ
jgi:hypothetical protein